MKKLITKLRTSPVFVFLMTAVVAAAFLSSNVAKSETITQAELRSAIAQYKDQCKVADEADARAKKLNKDKSAKLKLAQTERHAQLDDLAAKEKKVVTTEFKHDQRTQGNAAAVAHRHTKLQIIAADRKKADRSFADKAAAIEAEVAAANAKAKSEKRIKQSLEETIRTLRAKLNPPRRDTIVVRKVKRSNPKDNDPPATNVPGSGPLFKDKQFLLTTGELEVEIGGGVNFPVGNRQLPNYGQAITGRPGALLFAEFGYRLDQVIGPVGIRVGLVGQYQNWNHKRLVNNPPFGGFLPLGGNNQAFSLYPRFTVFGPLAKNIKWRGGFGAGLAFQKMKATNGGLTVISGKKTTAMVNLNGGLGYALTPDIDIWLNGFATWLDGYTVRTNTNVPSRQKAHWNAGGFVSVQFSLYKFKKHARF